MSNHQQAIDNVRKRLSAIRARWDLAAESYGFRGDLDEGYRPYGVVAEPDRPFPFQVVFSNPNAEYPMPTGFTIDDIEWCVSSCKGQFYRTKTLNSEAGSSNVMNFTDAEDAIRFKLVRT